MTVHEPIESTFVLKANDGTTIGSYSLSPGTSTADSWSTVTPSTEGSSTKTVTASATGHSDVSKSTLVVVDSTPPTAPSNVAAAIKKGSFNVTLSWRASTDSGSGIDHYDIKRNSTKIAATIITSYTDKPGKGTFSYTIEAFDKAGNSLGSSTSVTVK